MCLSLCFPTFCCDHSFTGGCAASRADQHLPSAVSAGRPLVSHVQLLRCSVFHTGTLDLTLSWVFFGISTKTELTPSSSSTVTPLISQFTQTGTTKGTSMQTSVSTVTSVSQLTSATMPVSTVTSAVTAPSTTPQCTDCQCNGGTCIYNVTLESCQCQCQDFVFGDSCSFGENDTSAHIGECL